MDIAGVSEMRNESETIAETAHSLLSNRRFNQLDRYVLASYPNSIHRLLCKYTEEKIERREYRSGEEEEKKEPTRSL